MILVKVSSKSQFMLLRKYCMNRETEEKCLEYNCTKLFVNRNWGREGVRSCPVANATSTLLLRTLKCDINMNQCFVLQILKWNKKFLIA